MIGRRIGQLKISTRMGVTIILPILALCLTLGLFVWDQADVGASIAQNKQKMSYLMMAREVKFRLDSLGLTASAFAAHPAAASETAFRKSLIGPKDIPTLIGVGVSQQNVDTIRASSDDLLNSLKASLDEPPSDTGSEKPPGLETLKSTVGEVNGQLTSRIARERQAVAASRADLTATLDSSTMWMSTIIVASIVLCLGLCWLMASSISRQIVRLQKAMARIAGNDYDVELECVEGDGEIARMVSAVEVFRQNGRKVSELTEAEKAAENRRLAERAEMMGDLQTSFGMVVDAAARGDFGRRVDATFSDSELNALASSVNDLVETVDRGLTETGTVLAGLAEADLSFRVKGVYDGAFGELKDNTNAVAEKLAEIVGRLKSTSQTLKAATGQILEGSNDLSTRTTKQAATIEETSAAMERLAVTVANNAGQAEQASRNTRSMSEVAAKGGEVMNRATSAMEEIMASSGKISNIIGMIDDIAFQTNLLALNASVEAARAGGCGAASAEVRWSSV